MSNQKSTRALPTARLSRIAAAAPVLKRSTTPIAKPLLEQRRDTTPETPSATATRRDINALTTVQSPGSTSTSSENTLTDKKRDVSFDPAPFKVVRRGFLPHGTSPGVFGAISPDHRFVCTLGNNGLVSFFDTLHGTLMGCLNFEDNCGTTSVVWVSSSQVIVGCAGGHTLLARLMLEARPGSRLAAITVVGNGTTDDPPVALAFDSGRGLLAVVTRNTLTIWRCMLNSERKRTWDRIEGGHSSLQSIGHTACFFGGYIDRFLFIGTNDGYAVWSYRTKEIQRNIVGTYPIGQCAVSPGGRFLAATKSNSEVLVWPIMTSGISCGECSSFVIPTGREWATGASFPPINFVDDNAIITADPVGNIYLLTARAEWTPAYLYALALGPGGTTIIASLTDDQLCFQSNYNRKVVDLTHGEPFIIQGVRLTTLIAPGPTDALETSDNTAEKYSEGSDSKNQFLLLFEKLEVKLMVWALVAGLLVLTYDSIIDILYALTKLFGFTAVLIIDFILVIVFYTLALLTKSNHGDYETPVEPTRVSQWI